MAKKDVLLRLIGKHDRIRTAPMKIWLCMSKQLQQHIMDMTNLVLVSMIVKTGNYHGALEKNGPYLEMLKFFNDLYQKVLVDPDSMTQTYDKMAEKVQNGGVLFSIFNYSGSLAYNKDEHTKAGKMMYCLKPEDASPIVYGMNTQGGNRITSIGANTEYPQLRWKLKLFCNTGRTYDICI